MTSTKQLHARAQALIAEHDIDTVEVAFADTQGHLRGKRIPATFFLARTGREGLRAGGRVVLLELALRAARAPALQPGLRHRRHDRRARPRDAETDAVARPRRACAWPIASASTTTSRSRWIRATSCAGRSSAARSAASSPVLATEIEFYLTDAETGQPVYDGIQCYSLQKGAEIEHVVGAHPARDRGLRHRRRGLEHRVRPGAGRDQLRPRPGDRGLRRHRSSSSRSCARSRATTACARRSWRSRSPASRATGCTCTTASCRTARTSSPQGTDDQPLGNASMRHWVAGLATHAAQLSLLANPTVNAYKRIEDYSFAPTRVSWGLDNRNVAVRCIPRRRRGLARRVPRRRRRRQPVPAGGRHAGRGHGRRRARAGAAARRPSRTPTPTSACRSCRARWAPRSRPGRRRRSRARRSASASPTTTRASPATTRRSTTRPSPTGKRSATGSSHSLVATRASARPTMTVDDRRDTCLREALAA